LDISLQFHLKVESHRPQPVDCWYPAYCSFQWRRDWNPTDRSRWIVHT